MSAILIDENGATRACFARIDPGAAPSEAWLRDVLFTHPETLPLDRIDPALGEVPAIVGRLAEAAGGGGS